ncbi:MAG: 1-deoxy-D-xylulose-5-phosphate synthase [Deltaproteobacteria bacterium]|nr:1-deoxy-D-xylulose-5-phosphate synthase [Deltaproteobacteria bacterium]MBW2417868.1 1-deoxy-D-xylulose-5-phosphate synthase [Deltaproteobacteria bacterium]
MGESLLQDIRYPEDLRKLPAGELDRVADALRAELVRLAASNGGHFAGSLGTVELTVALHYAFETPRDRLIWDVGHQAHGHKALTGRREELPRIKRSDGPSGFLRRSESAYDVFGAGHAGTSVSAGLGIAEAMRRQGSDARVVSVIGDGAATCGMAFEALNHAGEIGVDLKVVLNDNGMSIAPSVGGLARSGGYRAYFESLGIGYAGPVDGHDLAALLEAVRELRDATGPQVLHVKTRKGRGYAPAEADPFGWHATSPFDVASGERAPAASGGPPSWTEAFADALARLADRDPRLVAITAAMPDGTGLDRFARSHPERVYDVGIAEQHAVTFAAGLAAEGQRPVCAIYSSFLQRAFDQIVHDVALQRLPVIFALDRAGLVGADGPTHHGALDLSYLRMIPGLVVAAPRDENELQHLLATALESDRPFALRFPRGAAPGVPLDPDPKPLPIGRGEVLREGRDVALVALGKTVAAAQQAADLLAVRGISAAVVDARFVKPLDDRTLTRVAKQCGAVLTVEDHAIHGGFGSAVLELLADTAPEVAIRRLGIPDRFLEHGSVEEQWRAAGIDADSIAAQVLRWLDGDAS